MNYEALTNDQVVSITMNLSNYFDAPTLQAILRVLDNVLASANKYTDDNIPVGT